ncbi:MAG: lipase family protein [Gammaproteobacteria bacterium]
MSRKLPLLIPLFLMGCTTLSNEEFVKPYQTQRDTATSIATAGKFDVNEAKPMLEFCIELNNQDDRMNPKLPDPDDYLAKPTGWNLVYDSRNPGNTEWNKIWPYTEQDKEQNKPNPNDIESNGLAPLNNAWLLAESQTEPGVYAVAIRGTVAEMQSVLADTYATTIPAYAGIEYPRDTPLPIVFASTPMAEVHLGFAYAAMALLLDDDRGILTQLKETLKHKPIRKLYITGHSQGAAVATLIHAFLYYAINDQHIPYKLHALQDTTLKSYLFAQPKPGNLQFAQDFARIAAEKAFVVNNDRDPVPQVPLSGQTISEVASYVEADNADVAVGSFLDRLISKITDAKNDFRGTLAELPLDVMAKKFDKANIARSLDEYFDGPSIKLEDTKANSLNYTLAGQLVPVFGIEKGGDLYPIVKIDGKEKRDILLQHHATSYRKLVEQQLSNP